MKTIVITGIGGDIAQAAATIIRGEYPHIKIVGLDTHSEHAGTLFADKVVMVPPADSDEYLDAVRGVITENCVDVIIPISEPELEVIGPLASELGINRCITAGNRVIEVGTDKYLTANVLTELGIPMPWTTLAADGKPEEYPCIFKSRFGSGSRVVFVVHDASEASFLTDRYKNAIFQELLEPAKKEITCAVYRCREGRTASLLMLRRLAGGFTSWARTIQNDVISKMCSDVAEGLDLRGSMNVQLRLTNDGPRIFEINPRFSSTVLMRHQLGFTDLLWSLAESQQQTLTLPDQLPSGIMVRTQHANIISSGKSK